MTDYTKDIVQKTWNRNVDVVNKIGYVDGAADGQAAVFQSSFDMGYKQGLNFGIKLGFINATNSLQRQGQSDIHNIHDPRKINCQLCLAGISPEQNVVNQFNIQQEKNTELINEKQSIEDD